MKKSMNGRHPATGQQGFTLVEMSIVLVVIGVILGAVAIGTGLQRDAEQARIKQTFIDSWVQAYNSYYQRAGVVLGDDQTDPRLMVNGSNYTSGNTTVSGGDMSGVTSPGPICESATAPGLTGTENDMRNQMQRMGVDLPAGRAEGREDRYLYLDTNGNPQELQVCFQWNAPGTPSGSGNVMVVTGLTPDMARAMDRMIDGAADARRGAFRQDGVAGAEDSAEWNVDNLVDIDNNTANQESQIAVVTAHMKMNR